MCHQTTQICFTAMYEKPVAGASRTNCKRSASHINKVQPPPLTVQANTWLISLFNLWCSGAFYTHLWILLVLVSHQKYPHLLQHRCFQSRWFEGGTEAAPSFCKGEGGDGEHRAQPNLCSSISSCSAPMGWGKNSYFVRPFPCLHPLSQKTGLCLYATAFLKENLKFPQWIHPAVCMDQWISKIHQCPHYSPGVHTVKDFKQYQGHGTWAPT